MAVLTIKEEKSIDNSSVDCLKAFQIFVDYQSVQKTNLFFSDWCQKIDVKPNFYVSKNDLQGKEIAKLEIEFLGDGNITTYFQAERKSLKLSNALGLIGDLKEIFERIKEANSEKIPALEDAFSKAITSTKEQKVLVEGKELAAFYPLNGRVVLTTRRGQSSIPIIAFQNCAHLFNPEFAKEICPLLDLQSNLSSLIEGLFKIYIGRCLVGLAKSIRIRRFTELAHGRELERIIGLIQKTGFSFYPNPLL